MSIPSLPVGRHLPGHPVQQRDCAGGAAEAAAEEAVVADVPPHVPPLHRRPPRRRLEHPATAHLGHYSQVWQISWRQLNRTLKKA